MTKGTKMTTSKLHRIRGFQLRRIAFALKVLASVWTISMLVLFFTRIQLTTFFAATTGIVLVSLPILVLAATFDSHSERQFLAAAAKKATAKATPLLGVVAPKKTK